MLAALGAFLVVAPCGFGCGPLAPGTADVAAALAGSNAATATSATTPRIAWCRRDLVMSGDLSDHLTAATPGVRTHPHVSQEHGSDRILEHLLHGVKI